MPKSVTAAAALTIVLAIQHAVFAASTEVAKAHENRKKPLQRCDQLADKAQMECLQKARERVVEARNKREAAAQKQAATSGKSK